MHELVEPVALKLHTVIIVEVIQAHDRIAAGQQPFARMKADESGRTRYQNLRHRAPRVPSRSLEPPASRLRRQSTQAPASLSAICGATTRRVVGDSPS